ncbi:hypothetical protein SEUCBS140593_001181 [Sporothrix eucalyptigena]|uniref:aspartate--tRNA ligase n=1 Tax=Sporothrix eucalyptigena TaxID=1812306 RepID=A0ABP0AW20_9PEZI
MSAPQPTEVPAAETAPAATPAATDAAAAPAGDGEGEGPSKKAAKKAEAKAKKEALKAQRAAERAAAEAAAKAAGGGAGGEEVDLATENYGDVASFTAKGGLRFTDGAVPVALPQLGEEHVDKPVRLYGWIQNSRMQGAKMCFVELREQQDWTIQGVLAATKPDTKENIVSRAMVKWAGSRSFESCVVVEALVRRAPEPIKSCKVSGYELHITKFFVVAAAPQTLGLTLASANKAVNNFDDTAGGETTEAVEEAAEGVKNLDVSGAAGAAATESTIAGASLGTHLDNIVMHKRAPVQQAIANVRYETEKLFREYLDSRGFKGFQAPGLIDAASEGGANVFQLTYFGKPAFLAQSPQFYKQYEIAGGRKRVFCVGPVYRAENSNTPRHMTEFTGLDMEMEIQESYHEVLHMLEGVLLHIFRGLKQRCAEDIETVRTVYPSTDFLLPEPGKEVRLTFAEGQQLLREHGPAEFRNVTDDEDMSTPQEKALGELVRQKYNTEFYVLDKFPQSARPFYTMEDPTNPEVCNAYDFFMRGQEILSGGQRIHEAGLLEARMRRKGLDPKSEGLKEYVDVFRQAGVPPHGGGGIGLDRVVAFFLNLPSVQLAAYYPRTPKRLLP